MKNWDRRMWKPGYFSRKRKIRTAGLQPPFRVRPPVRKSRIRPPADWDFPRRTIMVVGMPRSGTNYLCRLMKSTGVLGCPEEFFNPPVALQYDAQRGYDLVFRVMLPNIAGRSANSVAAVKAFDYNFDKFQTRLNILDFYPDPVFVYVRRRDMLGQAVSFARALQTGEWTSQYEAQYQPRYSADAIHGALMDLVIQQARWDAFFARNEVAPLEVCYEDLLGNEASVLREIARRVGLGEDEGRIPFEQPTLSVQRDELSADWRARFVAERADLGWLEKPVRRLTGWRKPKRLVRLLLGEL